MQSNRQKRAFARLESRSREHLRPLVKCCEKWLSQGRIQKEDRGYNASMYCNIIAVNPHINLNQKRVVCLVPFVSLVLLVDAKGKDEFLPMNLLKVAWSLVSPLPPISVPATLSAPYPSIPPSLLAPIAPQLASDPLVALDSLPLSAVPVSGRLQAHMICLGALAEVVSSSEPVAGADTAFDRVRSPIQPAGPGARCSGAHPVLRICRSQTAA